MAMTDTDTTTGAQDEVPNTLLEDSEDEKSGTDIVSKTEPSSEISDNETHISSDKKVEDDTNKKPPAAAAAAAAVGKSHPQPSKEYGSQWHWDPEAKDYTQTRDGITIRYREYQRTGGKVPLMAISNLAPGPSSQPNLAAQSSEPPPPSDLPQDQNSILAAEKETETEGDDGWEKVNPSPQIPPAKRGSISSEISLALGPTPSIRSSPIPRQPAPAPPSTKALKEYEEPLDKGFTTVEKPKRFFQVGRIFATVWFEPGGQGPTGRKADLEWTDDCPEYHGEKPIAKFRWFIVARKRLHHSLCFNITTVGPNGPRKADRGRGMDFVVLHSSNIEPSKPFEVEGITKDPIGVIIEVGDESISPWARLDCGRIYTVEDNLRVMKIGRVHTGSLPLLEDYFKQSVA